MSEDNPLNYPERPRVLDVIVSQAFQYAGKQHGLPQQDIDHLTEIVLGDEQYRIAAEEFECDRGDQYEHLFESDFTEGDSDKELSRGGSPALPDDPFGFGPGVTIIGDPNPGPDEVDLRTVTGYERPDLRTPEHDPFNPPGFERQQFYPRMIPNPAYQGEEEWFSMETAPLDGTEILGIDENDPDHVTQQVIKWVYGSHWAYANGEYSFTPTRWRPAPKPAPKAEPEDPRGYFGNTLPGSGINTLYFGKK